MNIYTSMYEVCVVFLLASILLNLNARPRYYVVCGECVCAREGGRQRGSVCACLPRCAAVIFSQCTHTYCTSSTRAEKQSNSNQIAFYLCLAGIFIFVWTRSPLLSTQFCFLLLFSSVCQALTHTLVCSFALATLNVCVRLYARVLRVNAIREIIIAVDVLLETTKQLQSSYISRRKEAKQ